VVVVVRVLVVADAGGYDDGGEFGCGFDGLEGEPGVSKMMVWCWYGEGGPAGDGESGGGEDFEKKRMVS